jgi:hypothetical protein
MRTVLPLIVAALLAGCVESPPALDSPDACGAPGLQGLVGQRESVLAAMTLPAERLRVIQPGMAVTMDYSPTRLNIEVGTDGRIARVYCG